MTAKSSAMLGAFSAMLAVMLGAFGAHALKAELGPDMMAVYQTANHYQFIHSLALLMTALFWQMGLADSGRVEQLFRWSATLFALGLLLFCGSLYTLSLTQIRPLGAVTPFGGVAFIIGWGLLLFALFRGAWPSEQNREH